MGFFDIFRVSAIKKENAELSAKLAELNADDIFSARKQLSDLNAEIASDNQTLSNLRSEIDSLSASHDKISKQFASQSNKLSRCKELYESVQYSISNFTDLDPNLIRCKITPADQSDLDLISPSVILKLHSMDMKDLKKAFRENQKQIEKLLESYSSRYTTKANKSIYSLMVIALQAELQNVLYNLKYEKLEKSISDIKNVTAKYLTIAGDGNQSIAGTLTKFIGQIEYLFINAIKIEYNYYLRKEQAKQEQLALKEQMRQEADERKALDAEKKKIEKEESKYFTEIEKLKQQLAEKSEAESATLNARILELQSQLSSISLKKEEISNLQNGKAGNVYIISNIGSFGENVFKIGMTRRLDPQDRINELGNASVPFKFDVHSFIFSDDAVRLENELHERLNDNRVNKVNLRKEFFKIDISELEELVSAIDPTAEFNKTALAEEFYISMNSDHVYSPSSDLDSILDDDE